MHQLCCCDLPAIDVVHDTVRFGIRRRGEPYILLNPQDEVILERAFNNLMQYIGRDESVDVRSRKAVCEWLTEKRDSQTLIRRYTGIKDFRGSPQRRSPHQIRPRASGGQCCPSSILYTLGILVLQHSPSCLDGHGI